MLLGILSCCFGPGACPLCCGEKKVKKSVVTRLLYLPFLLFVIVASSIMLSTSVANELADAVSCYKVLSL